MELLITLATIVVTSYLVSKKSVNDKLKQYESALSKLDSRMDALETEQSRQNGMILLYIEKDINRAIIEGLLEEKDNESKQ